MFSLARQITVAGTGTSTCRNRGIAPAVTICTPLGGSQTGRSIHVVAQSAGLNVIVSTSIFVDGKKAYSTSGGAVDTYVNAQPGVHRVMVQSADSGGSTWSTTVGVVTQ